MIGWLNLGSLILGLIAFISPVVNLLRYEKGIYKSPLALSVMSFSACAILLWFQIFNSYQLLKIGDVTAIMDTADAVTFFALAFLIVTIGLNVITLFVYRNGIAKYTHNSK